MKVTFITLLFALSLPLGLFAAEDLHADSHISAGADVEHTESVEPAEGGGVISELAGNFGISWPTLIAQMVNFCIVAFVLYILLLLLIRFLFELQYIQTDHNLTQPPLD